MTNPLAIGPDQLPAAITTYLAAHRVRDAETAITYYADDATVTDDGQQYRGRDAILDWLTRAASEYTYTTELIGAEKVDDNRFLVINHLEGDFPGGVVDLRFRFTLRDGHIVELVIAT